MKKTKRFQNLRDLKKALSENVQIEHRYAGVACPNCGYVFDRGFSNITSIYDKDNNVDEAQPKPIGPHDSILTACTRCRKILVMQNERLRVITGVDKALMSESDRKKIDLINDILALAVLHPGRATN